MNQPPHRDYMGSYLFGHLIGPVEIWFAWFPVKTWYGSVVWLKKVRRQRLIKKGWLDGPDWECWVYSA